MTYRLSTPQNSRYSESVVAGRDTCLAVHQLLLVRIENRPLDDFPHVAVDWMCYVLVRAIWSSPGWHRNEVALRSVYHFELSRSNLGVREANVET